MQELISLASLRFGSSASRVGVMLSSEATGHVQPASASKFVASQVPTDGSSCHLDFGALRSAIAASVQTTVDNYTTEPSNWCLCRLKRSGLLHKILELLQGLYCILHVQCLKRVTAHMTSFEMTPSLLASASAKVEAMAA